MSFKLIDEVDCVKGEQIYRITLYFDSDTNTQKHQYILNDETLYQIEYEVEPVEDPESNLEIDSIANGFDNWYDQFGPDWRPEPF